MTIKRQAGGTKIILAIETSCDETAAAVLELQYSPPLQGGVPGASRGRWLEHAQIKTLSSVVKSQIQLHKKMGGVVPEAAARAHVRNILPVVNTALSNVKCQMSNVDYIAVTQGPGLIPSLIVGVEFAKALSLATGIPVLPINHMAGHLYSPFGKTSNVKGQMSKVFPMICLIVSGGHTILAVMENIKKYKVLGETVDDAAGEAFDKVARLLKLPYPGGPQVSRLAMESKAPAQFPRPMINSKNYNFSFAGLKTSVLYYLRDNPKARPADICAGFQEAVVDVLVTKAMRAARAFKAKSISLSGGVAANKALREQLIVNCKLLNVKFMVPPINLCTDNAEMIGLAAAYGLMNKTLKPVPFHKISADPNLSL